jgi:hypothetical protein
MNNKEISPVILSSIELMKKINNGLEIEILGEMIRSESNEYHPLGQLGVNTKMSFFGIEKNLFLTHQLCEDMHNPLGHLVAEDYIMGIFKDDFMKMYAHLKGNENV